jgi:hypothetical protein
MNVEVILSVIIQIINVVQLVLQLLGIPNLGAIFG